MSIIFSTAGSPLPMPMEEAADDSVLPLLRCIRLYASPMLSLWSTLLSFMVLHTDNFDGDSIRALDFEIANAATPRPKPSFS